MWRYVWEEYVVMNTTPSKLLRDAMLLGRVERLLGNNVSVNPFPKHSNRWLAFRAGWFRSLDDPVCQELRILRHSTLQREKER